MKNKNLQSLIRTIEAQPAAVETDLQHLNEELASKLKGGQGIDDVIIDFGCPQNCSCSDR